MIGPVAAFLRDQITYERLYSDFLKTYGACLSLHDARAVLERIGVVPGALVVSSGPFFSSPSARVFFVRDLAYAPIDRVVLLTARSYPYSVREALQLGRWLGGSAGVGVFSYFRPRGFDVIARIDPAFVKLAVVTGTYDALVRSFVRKFLSREEVGNEVGDEICRRFLERSRPI